MAKAPLIVFDLDGTLVDSVPDIAAAVNRTLAARGLPGLSDTAIAGMVGDGLVALMKRAFAAAGASPDEAAAGDYLADYESNILVDTRLFDGIPEALDALEQAGWRMAVCTNKPERAARLLLGALGIGGRFQAIGGGDSFPNHKPDPSHLQGTIKLADGDPARALMVGDHTNDMLAAEGSRVQAIFAAWGYGRPGMERGAAAVAATPQHLAALSRSLAEQW